MDVSLCPGLSSCLCLPCLMGCLSLGDHWPYQLAGRCLLPHLLSPLTPHGPALGASLLQQPMWISEGSQMRALTLLNPSTCSQKQNQCLTPLIPWEMEQEPLWRVENWCYSALLLLPISLLLSPECLQSPGPSAWYFTDIGDEQALASPHCCKNMKRTQEG